MRMLLTICTALTASGMLANPSLAHAEDGIASLDDIVLLARSDISDLTTLTFLKYRTLDFVPDAGAVQRLQESGVSKEIVSYLLQRDATSLVVAPAYVVATGYNSIYPSYYYGARLVGTTTYPLSWYSHHYYPRGFASIYRPGAHFGPGSSIGHPVGFSLSHDRDPALSPAPVGGNHPLGHSAFDAGHSVGYGLSHAIGHGIGH